MLQPKEEQEEREPSPEALCLLRRAVCAPHAPGGQPPTLGPDTRAVAFPAAVEVPPVRPVAPPSMAPG